MRTTYGKSGAGLVFLCSPYVHSQRRTAYEICDEERSERGIRVIRSLPPKRKSTATHRAHASIHLAGPTFFIPLPQTIVERVGECFDTECFERFFAEETSREKSLAGVLCEHRLLGLSRRYVSGKEDFRYNSCMGVC